MNWTLGIPTFIVGLEHAIHHNFAHDYVADIEIGTEFSSPAFTTGACNWSLSYYYEVKGAKYNLLWKE